MVIFPVGNGDSSEVRVIMLEPVQPPPIPHVMTNKFTNFRTKEKTKRMPSK